MNKKEALNNYSKLKWVVDKACHDGHFKKTLLSHPNETLKKEGIHVESKKVMFVENSLREFNIVIPHTKLSAKLQLEKLPKNPKLGDIYRFLSTKFFKSPAEKSQILKNPTDYLTKQGARLPEGLKIKVFESTPSMTYIVIPRVPEDGVELNSLELESFSGGSIWDDIGNAISSGLSTAVNATIQNPGFINAVAQAGEGLEEGMSMPGEEG